MRKLNVLISAWSNDKKWVNGQSVEFMNPKNYPYWHEVVGLIRALGHHTVQIMVDGEKVIGANGILINTPLVELSRIVKNFDIWLSVDNFFPHLAACQAPEKHGIVIFSRSDPKIFGYEHNYNLLRSPVYLRNDQHGYWWDCEYIEEAFVSPDEVLKAFLTQTGQNINSKVA